MTILGLKESTCALPRRQRQAGHDGHDDDDDDDDDNDDEDDVDYDSIVLDVQSNRSGNDSACSAPMPFGSIVVALLLLVLKRGCS